MNSKKTKIFAALFFCIFFAPAASRAAGYDFYVDKNSTKSTQNGSASYPWKTIQATLDHIESHGLEGKTVYIKDGTYRESIEITNGAKLFGQGESLTIIDANGKNNAVKFSSTGSELKNISVKNADSTNIVVDKKSKVAITNCKIENAGKYGIEVKESSTASKYQFTLKSSEVSGSRKQGLYISRRKISVSGNDILDNDEEGMDIHSGAKGAVSGNSIRSNGESGIEAMLAGANLKIKNNDVKSNRTQGITVQIYSSKKKGKVTISRNTIKNNRKYGIRVANYTHSLGPAKFKEFAEKYIKLSKNKISGNGKKEKVRYE